MSVRSQTSRDLVQIERLSATQSETGGQIRVFSAANRGSRPTSVRCRIQPLGAREHVEFGVRGSRIAWKFLFADDPQITVEDRLIFTDSDGQTHTARVLEPSHNLDMQSRLYRVVAEKIENEQ